MSEKIEADLTIETRPTRAIFVMRGLVGLDAPIGPGDLQEVLASLDLGEEDTALDVLVTELDDGNRAMTMGDLDVDEQRDTHLVVLVEAPGYGTFKCLFGQQRLAALWAAKRELLSGKEPTAMAKLVASVLRFAADEGGVPADAFGEWLGSSKREGALRIYESKLAA